MIIWRSVILWKIGTGIPYHHNGLSALRMVLKRIIHTLKLVKPISVHYSFSIRTRIFFIISSKLRQNRIPVVYGFRFITTM